jgi:lipopolysaccharide transport system permease protein
MNALTPPPINDSPDALRLQLWREAPLLAPTARRLRPARGWAAIDWRELWAYRELLVFLTARDVLVRYKQTLLGATWAILQPFLTMVVFSLVFGYLAGIPSDGVPYPIFAFTALVPWTFFANGLAQASNSLVSSANLIKKVYFPRLMIPLASILGGLPDLLLSLAVLLLMLPVYQIPLSFGGILWIMLFLVLMLMTAFGVGLWLAALNVRYRDIRYVVPFLVQLWLYITPIAYPSSLLPEALRPLYALNPMVGVVEGFRWALLSNASLNDLDRFNPLATVTTFPAPGGMLIVSLAMALVLFFSGLFYFRRVERSFADIV